MNSEEFEDDFENQEENLEIFNDEVSDDEISDDEIIIEDSIVDEEITDVVSDLVEEEFKEEVVLSKHTIHKKHSLNYDSIFKGKKENPLTEDDYDTTTSFNETFEVDKSSIYWYESVDNENYIKEKRIKERVYDVLANHTDLNFLNNRRKPSRSDFNHFYFLLKTNLQD